MKNINRRNFVKGSALATGFALTNPLNAGIGAFGGGSDTLKLAVVGCGGRGTGAVSQALNADEGVELVAMADAFQDRLDSCYSTLSNIFDKKRLKVKDKNKFVGFGSY
ncbi:MAG: dehydrogenase, partial [Cyclobacteriaceae bacterium]|nr:dehydrogenase [Cyclobacteriaceae bacterium]